MQNYNVHKTRRIEFVDIAKSIAIFLVILGHTVKADSGMKVLIYSFHMPLFFIMSGFFVRSIQDFTVGSFFTYIKKKWVALMVPFFLWGLVYSKFSFINAAYLLYGSYTTIGYSDALSSLWFLPVMFLSFIIIYPVEVLKSKYGFRTLINILVAFLFFSISFLLPNGMKLGYPWSVNVAFMAAGFLLMGGVFWHVSQKLSKLIIVFLLLLGILAFSFFCQISTSSIGYMRMADANFGDPIVCIANSLLGSMNIILLSIVLSWFKLPMKLVTIIGANTLGIFLTHKPFIGLFKTVTIFLHLPKDNFFTLLLIAVLTMVSSIMVTIVINKYMPILLGRNNKKII